MLFKMYIYLFFVILSLIRYLVQGNFYFVKIMYLNRFIYVFLLPCYKYPLGPLYNLDFCILGNLTFPLFREYLIFET